MSPSIHELCKCRSAPGELCSPGCAQWQESTSKPFRSALLSAFLNMPSNNSALFLGHRPCVQPHCLAWAHLPTPPLYWRIAADTWWLFEYAYPSWSGSFVNVLQVNTNIWTSWFGWFCGVFWGSPGQVKSKSFSKVTFSCFGEEYMGLFLNSLFYSTYPSTNTISS